MVSRITGSEIVNLRTEINKALESVAKKHGLKIMTGNCTYSDVEARFTLDVAVRDNVTGIPMTRERTAFQWHGAYYRLDPSWLDKEIEIRGQRYRIAGLNTRARRYKVQIVNVQTNKPYKASVEMIKHCIKEGA